MNTKIKYKIDNTIVRIKAAIAKRRINIIENFKDTNNKSSPFVGLGIRKDFLSQFYEQNSLQSQNKARRDISRITHSTKFHSNWLDSDQIKISGPFTGKIIECQYSFFFNLKKYHAIIYHFHDTVSFDLIIGDYWSEVIGLYVQCKSSLIIFRPSIFNIENFAFDLAKECLVWRIKKVIGKVNPKKRSIVLYHSHFAHHIWNELSAIEKRISTKNHLDIDTIYYESLPIGNLESIFPSLKKSKIRMKQKDLNKNRYKIGESSIIYPLKSAVISSNLVFRLKNHFNSNTSTKVLDKINLAKKAYKQVVWISVRTINRSFYLGGRGFSKFLKFLDKKEEETLVIIDGFSKPFKVDTKSSKAFIINIEREKKITQRFLDSLVLNNIKIKNLIGKSIIEVFSWSKIATYYITHLGTLHHKINWFYDIPGVVHAEQNMFKSKLRNLPGFNEVDNVHLPFIAVGSKIDSESIQKDKFGRNLSAKSAFYTLDWDEIIRHYNHNYNC